MEQESRHEKIAHDCIYCNLWASNEEENALRYKFDLFLKTTSVLQAGILEVIIVN